MLVEEVRWFCSAPRETEQSLTAEEVSMCFFMCRQMLMVPGHGMDKLGFEYGGLIVN